MKKTMQYTWNEIKGSHITRVTIGYYIALLMISRGGKQSGLLVIITMYLILLPLMAVANTDKTMQSNVARTYISTGLTRKGFLRAKFLISLIMTCFFYALLLALGKYLIKPDNINAVFLTDFFGMLVLGVSMICILVGFNTVFVLGSKAMRFGTDILAVVIVNGLFVFFAPRLIAFLGFGKAFPETGVDSIKNIRGITNWLIYDVALVKTFPGFIAIAGVTALLSFLFYKLGLRLFMKKDL